MAGPTAGVLREHLAYEIHYLLLAASQFPEIGGRDATIYQDSALLHGRNLLELTKPPRRPGNGWWIPDVGGETPTPDATHKGWVKFINANVSHLGERRGQGIQWPSGDVHGRLIELAQYALERIKSLLPQGSNDERIVVMNALADLGLSYLDDRAESTLSQIADALDNRLPIHTRDANTMTDFSPTPTSPRKARTTTQLHMINQTTRS